jgi:hypothetical protein
MKFKEIMELVEYLVGVPEGGEARHTFRQSIINDLQTYGGYSAVCAEQVMDELERYVRKDKKLA